MANKKLNSHTQCRLFFVAVCFAELNIWGRSSKLYATFWFRCRYLNIFCGDILQISSRKWLIFEQTFLEKVTETCSTQNKAELKLFKGLSAAVLIDVTGLGGNKIKISWLLCFLAHVSCSGWISVFLTMESYSHWSPQIVSCWRVLQCITHTQLNTV